MNHVYSVRSSLLYSLLQSVRGTVCGLLVEDIFHNYGDEVVLHDLANCVHVLCCSHGTLILNLSAVSDKNGKMTNEAMWKLVLCEPSDQGDAG